MDPAVTDEVIHGQPRDFTPDGIEAGEDDGFGRVVHDHVHAGDGLEGPYVPTLASDDAALHVVAREGDDRHGRLGGMVHGEFLDGLGDDLAGFPLGLAASPFAHLPHVLRGVRPRLVANLAHQLAPGVIPADARDLLEALPEFPLPVDEFLRPRLEFAALHLDLLAAPIHPLLTLVDHLQLLLERLAPLEGPLLQPFQLRTPALSLPGRFLPETLCLFAPRQLRRLAEAVCLQSGGLDDVAPIALEAAAGPAEAPPLDQDPGDAPCHETRDSQQHRRHGDGFQHGQTPILEPSMNKKNRRTRPPVHAARIERNETLRSIIYLKLGPRSCEVPSRTAHTDYC